MNKTSIFAFLAGAAVGGVVALLLAPQSGKNTRAMIKDAVNKRIGKGCCSDDCDCGDDCECDEDEKCSENCNC